MPSDTIKRVLAMPKGQVFALSSGGTVMLNAITRIRRVAQTREEVLARAQARLANDRAQEDLGRLRRSLRIAAKIRYAAGYAPTRDTQIASR